MRLTDWNAFDWLLISILLISMGMALRRGLVRAIFGLAGFFGGLELASCYYAQVGGWITDTRLIGSVPTARILAFLLIVVAAATACELAGQLLHRTLRAAGLSVLDRLLGLAFGFVRGCVIGIAVLMITINFAPRSWIVSTSVLSPYLFAAAHDVSFLVPQYLQQQMTNGAFNFKQTAPRWINRH